MHFSENLSRLMRARALNQQQLADALGVRQTTVSRWENGAVPHKRTLRQLADFFEVAVDDLLDGQKPGRVLKTATAVALANAHPGTQEEKQELSERPAADLGRREAHWRERARKAERELATLRAALRQLAGEPPESAPSPKRRRPKPSAAAPVPKRKRARRPTEPRRDVREVSLALYGEMGAGPAIAPSDEPIGYVRVPRDRKFPADAFCARVNGASMTEAGIRNGDLVVMRWTEHQEARPGDIVCVHLFGDGSVLKQLVERKGGHRWLVSRHPQHPDICLDCEGEPRGRIQAVMIGKV